MNLENYAKRKKPGYKGHIFYEMSRRGKSIKTENQLVVASD